MLLAPLAFVACVSIAYALVPYACASQRHGLLHAVSAVATLVVAAAMAAGVRDWRRDARANGGEREMLERRRLLAHVALGTCALALLATLALWATQFVVPPCAA